MRRSQALALLVSSWPALQLPSFADAAASANHPPCRKSPELHSLTWPEGHEQLVAFGGKGFVWLPKKGKKGKQKKHGKARGFSSSILFEEGDAQDILEEAALGREGPVNVTAEFANGDAELELAAKVKNVEEFGGELFKRKVRFFGDIWAFDVKNTSWSEAVPPDSDRPRPIPRWKPSSTSFGNKSGLILFGGCKSTEAEGVMNDLWLLRPTSCCPARAEWTQVFTANPPSPRRGHIIVANATHVVVVGGKGWSSKTGSVVLSDLWALPLKALGIEDVQTPAGKAGMHSAPQAVQEALALDGVLSGKKAGPQLELWTAGTGFPGPPRWGATGTLLQDGQGRQLLAVFGGRCIDGEATLHSTRAGAYTYYNDLWLYDFEADAWTLMEPLASAPHPRDHHGAANVNGDLYVFGGRIMELAVRDAVLNDLWSYSLATGYWTHHALHAATAPIARFMPGVSDTRFRGRDALAIFGGETLPGSTKRTSLNDVWVFAANASGESEWIQIFESDCSPVLSRPHSEEQLLEPLQSSFTDSPVGRLPVAAALPLFGIVAGAALFGVALWLRPGARCRGPRAAAPPAAWEASEAPYGLLG